MQSPRGNENEPADFSATAERNFQGRIGFEFIGHEGNCRLVPLWASCFRITPVTFDRVPRYLRWLHCVYGGGVRGWAIVSSHRNRLILPALGG